MLSQQDNELMCRVGPSTGMGDAMRRYWLPALQSSDLPEPGGDPKPIELLGEQFVAYRDAAGRVGIFADGCLHRGASLMLARAEGDGLRCIYHGWKFAVDGTVLDTPNVADPKFKQRIKGRTYPTREAGGLVWVYLGPKELEPDFPKWPWLDLPAAHRINTYAVVGCNFVQVVEGLVDSSHLTVLHASGLAKTTGSELDFAKKTSHMQFDAAPRIEADETDFGFHYVAMRPVGEQVMARIASFTAPCFVANANGDLWFAIVPVSDERTHFYHVWWDAQKKIGEEPMRSQQLKFVGLDPETLDEYGLGPATWNAGRAPRRENGYRQDKALQRAGHFTGIASFTQEDAICSVSGGAIRDRSTELLCTADVAITRLYRTLLSCVKRVREGQAPVGLKADTTKIVGTSAAIARDQDWRTLVPGHKIVGQRAAAAVEEPRR
jgi:phthalate 4,5-dioxygenase oxygenase subunit